MSNSKKPGKKKPLNSNLGKARKEIRTVDSGDDDHRTDRRIPIQLLVDYSCNGHYLFDFCKDLGAGGVFIQTSSPLPQGSNVDLTFTIPDSKETLETKGTVIWVQNTVEGRKDLTPGMGVQFSKFNGDQRKILESFVHRYHGEKRFMSVDDEDKKTA